MFGGDAQIPHSNTVFRVLDDETTEPSGSIAQGYNTTTPGTLMQPNPETAAGPHAQVALALATRSSAAVIADLKNSQRSSRLLSTTAYDLVARQDQKFTTSNNSEAGYLSGVGDSSEGEDNENAILKAKPQKVSERKRVRDAVYQSHLRSTLLNRQLRDVSIVGGAAIEGQSTRCLAKRKEMKSIISSPREYQVELFERAKEKNIIAVLDTGMGSNSVNTIGFNKFSRFR
jgi:endoribonuclease Dicer